jgi:hypothetical protein
MNQLSLFGIQEENGRQGRWRLQVSVNDDLLIVGILAYRQTGGAWIVELPVGVRIRNAEMLAELREMVAEACMAAGLQNRLAYLSKKQGATQS